MKLSPYQKADLLTAIAILMGLVALFPMTQSLVEAYLAPQYNLPAPEGWQFWAWVGWMAGIVFTGFIWPERYLRQAHRHYEENAEPRRGGGQSDRRARRR